MAKRRMLSIPILETDKFYKLTAASQAFYVHLNLNADDDGVVDKVNLIMGQMHLRRKCYQELVDGGYIIELEEGLIVITHWHQHNQIRKERYIRGEHLERLSSLSLQENGRFIKASSTFLGNKCAPQDSLVKDSTGEYSKAKGSEAEHKGEEEKERNNISLSHSYIQDGVASLPETDRMSDPLLYNNFLNAIRLYFMKKYNSLDSKNFISYYEGQNWHSATEKITADNYKYYVDEWMKG